MSKVTNDGLTQSEPGCFIAVHSRRQSVNFARCVVQIKFHRAYTTLIVLRLI